MTADVIPFPAPGDVALDPAHVEVSSPGTLLATGERFYVVDFVDVNGGRSGMWDGTSYEEALQAAAECAKTDKGTLPVLDRVVAAALDAPDHVKREFVEEARHTFDDDVATELANALGIDPAPITQH